MPLYSYNSSNATQQYGDSVTFFNNSARGRTFIASISYKFLIKNNKFFNKGKKWTRIPQIFYFCMFGLKIY